MFCSESHKKTKLNAFFLPPCLIKVFFSQKRGVQIYFLKHFSLHPASKSISMQNVIELKENRKINHAYMNIIKGNVSKTHVKGKQY